MYKHSKCIEFIGVFHVKLGIKHMPRCIVVFGVANVSEDYSYIIPLFIGLSVHIFVHLFGSPP